jgi:hypothetical protein
MDAPLPSVRLSIRLASRHARCSDHRGIQFDGGLRYSSAKDLLWGLLGPVPSRGAAPSFAYSFKIPCRCRYLPPFDLPNKWICVFPAVVLRGSKAALRVWEEVIVCDSL